MRIRYHTFLEQVRDRGEYASDFEAERAARTVLALLGAHLRGKIRADLADRLPVTFAVVLLNPLQSPYPLDAERFVRATAAWIEGSTEATALWDVSAVLSVVADVAGEDMLAEILAQLPSDFPPLFGRPAFDAGSKTPSAATP